MHKMCSLLLCLACLSSLAYAGKQPTEAQCSTAIASAQKTLDETPPAMTPRDKKDLENLKEKQEKLIKDGRSKGLRECEIWQQIMKMAFTQ